MEEAIKQTIKTKGWAFILDIFADEIKNSLSGIDIKDDNIATQYIGRKEAERIINTVFEKIEAIAYETEAKPINYK